MKRKSTPQTPEQTASPDKTHVMRAAASSASLASGDSRDKAPEQSVGSVSAAHGQGGFFAFAKPTVFALLLLLAMTVQTAPMALILCGLAFLSLLGKKPVARIRVRLSVPVVGLIGFAVVYGAAAIYSPFGETAIAEFYKFFAAFAVAVILLARYDREDAPGVLWGFGAVSAVIGVVSVDLACDGPVFRGFNALMSALGEDYGTVDQSPWGTQVAGIYNDANVTASLFALGAIVSLYLLVRADGWKKKLPAALVVGVNGLAFFLSMSRGGILCFAAALLVWLVLAGKGNRLPLFFSMALSAMSTVILSIPAASHIISGSSLPLVLLLGNGLVVFALDVLLAGRLTALAAAHAKAGMAAVAAVAVACAAYGVAAFTVKGPYTFDSTGLVFRSANLSAGDYQLTSPLDENVRVMLLGQTAYEKQLDQYETLYDSNAGDTAFTVPEGIVSTRWQLYAPEGTVVEGVELSDGTLVRLGYPLLPAFAANRLLAGMGSSFSLRWTYDRDALTLWAQAPIFGHGLGSTENLYRSVQSFQYESKYAHNHLLQTLSDTGLVGTVFALCFVLGAAWLCLWALKRERSGLAAALLASWVMMNLHSLMEISFSVRGYKCAAYVLLTLAAVCFANRTEEETAKARKRAKIAGIVVTVLYVLYSAVFGGLLESARMTDRRAADFQTGDAYEYLDFLRDCVRGDVFDHDFYQRSYVANAVQLNDPSYNGDMLKYVTELRASGTYENDSALARYYYLPREKWDDLFACSLEGIRQVRSSPDGWNYQMEFYRQEVLPAMGAENMDAFLSGVLELGDALDAMNAEGRMEEVSLDEENQTFLNLCRSAVEQGLSGTEAYTVLSMTAGSAGSGGQG